MARSAGTDNVFVSLDVPGIPVKCGDACHDAVFRVVRARDPRFRVSLGLFSNVTDGPMCNAPTGAELPNLVQHALSVVQSERASFKAADCLVEAFEGFAFAIYGTKRPDSR